MLMLARKFANYSSLGERSRALQHAPKIILGALLSCTLDIKIARLVLIFNLVLVLHVPPPPKKKAFYYNSFRNKLFIVI